MSGDLKLVVFDVDGTLVDSQAHILASMGMAFEGIGATAPTRKEVLSIVGLSLPQAMAQLFPQGSQSDHDRLVDIYKESYVALRHKAGSAASSPLYPGARGVLDALRAIDTVLLGVATGKSRRGLDLLIEGQMLEGYFVTQQVADDHPSKPHPSMLMTAMAETGVGPEQTVMIGDTSFDMDMAQAAGVRSVAVDWGYHPAQALSHADTMISDFDQLPRALDEFWGALA